MISDGNDDLLCLRGSRDGGLGLREKRGVGSDAERTLVDRRNKLQLAIGRSQQRVVRMTGLGGAGAEQQRDAEQRHKPQPGLRLRARMTGWAEAHHGVDGGAWKRSYLRLLRTGNQQSSAESMPHRLRSSKAVLETIVRRVLD